MNMVKFGGAFFAPFFVFMLIVLVVFGAVGGGGSASGGMFVGEYTEELPIFDEIKGEGQIDDEIAQLAVGAAVKYRLLPSVILSQYAYESEWGKSQSAENDTNFFGITWFAGCPFPKGSARGVGGSEGGWYMKFPNKMAAFSYYGYMVASQTNFNACVGNKNPGEALLVLGRGGYAAAGITEDSPYFKNCMGIIESNKFVGKYDKFAIDHWAEAPSGGGGESAADNDGSIDILESVMGQTINGGQCYGLTAYYVEKLGGPQMMGSGHMFAGMIGSDYNWSQFGWEVVFNPKFEDLQAGDVINWEGGGAISPGIYGHTGIIRSVGEDGTFNTYEQNAESGQICAKYTRNMQSAHIASIVRKVK